MTTESLFVLPEPAAKVGAIETLVEGLKSLEAAAERGASVRELEVLVRSVLITVGQLLLGHAVGLACRRAAAEGLEERGLCRGGSPPERTGTTGRRWQAPSGP